MAKVLITVEDGPDEATVVNAEFVPPLPGDIVAATLAQLTALVMLDAAAASDATLNASD